MLLRQTPFSFSKRRAGDEFDAEERTRVEFDAEKEKGLGGVCLILNPTHPCRTSPTSPLFLKERRSMCKQHSIISIFLTHFIPEKVKEKNRAIERQKNDNLTNAAIAGTLALWERG